MTRLNDLADEIRDLKGHTNDEPLEGPKISGIWDKISDLRIHVAEDFDVSDILAAIEYEHDKAKRFTEIIRCQSAVLRTIHERLDDVYDAESFTDRPPREAPFSGAGECLALARIALAKVHSSVPRETAELVGSDVFVYRKVEDEYQNALPAAELRA